MSTPYELAKTIATTLIRGTHAAGVLLTRQIIEKHVDAALGMDTAWRDVVNREALIKELETQCDVWIGTARTLESQEGHLPWLAQKRGRIQWHYWTRYRQHLAPHWPVRSVDGLDQLTDEILERLEDPEREGAWDRRGLVVGHVQSGKTANYVGLINKAVDAGYRVIIVLAGIHKSLRSQTQMRLDEGFLGYDSTFRSDNGSRSIGVGTVNPALRPDSITNRRDDGDFKKSVADSFGINPGNKPLLFVVKKNGSVLKNLVETWVAWAANSMDASGRKIVKGVPLLVIDDEADHASVDTKQQVFDENGEPDADHDPTIINRRIRKLLRCFEKSAYVGYTATPFANIFIHESGKTDEEGKDLFPESFIVNLPAPSDYVGPLKVFGMSPTMSTSMQPSPGLPIIRHIEDHVPDEVGVEGGWMPPGHKKTHVPVHEQTGSLPPSLQEAIRAFVVACACRRVRGQMVVHNSMLIHVTRFTDVQTVIKDHVVQYLAELRRRLRMGEGDAADGELAAIRRLWESDFVPTTEQMGEVVVSWKDVEANLSDAASAIVVRCINGTAKDILDYEVARKTGLSVIAVGGDKLARGLTLEGLSTSYFLRASRMYDTLMQMGRWFGYRPGYLDLCRMYMTHELEDWFEHITAANEELRQEFDRMVAMGGTPRDYGLRVKTHPALLVTSRVKMRNGVELDISFAGSIKETTTFLLQKSAITENLAALDKFISHLGDPSERNPTRERPDGARADWKGTRVWRDASANLVAGFLESVRTHPDAKEVNGKLLASFIRAADENGELTTWHVALIGRSPGEDASEDGEPPPAPPTMSLGGEEHVMVVRRGSSPDDGKFTFKRLVNPRDESIDLEVAEYAVALDRTGKLRLDAERGGTRSPDPPKMPSGPMIRTQRPATRGLLLLYPFRPGWSGKARRPDLSDMPLVGFAVSFPASGGVGTTVKYKVNNVYWEQEFGAER